MRPKSLFSVIMNTVYTYAVLCYCPVMAVKVFKFLYQPLCTVPMNDVIGYWFTSVMLRPAGYKAIGLLLDYV